MKIILYHIENKGQTEEQLIDYRKIEIKHDRITKCTIQFEDKQTGYKFELVKLSKGDLPRQKHELTHKLNSELIDKELNINYDYYLKLKPQQFLIINFIKFINNKIKFIKIISFITLLASIVTLIMFANECSRKTSKSKTYPTSVVLKKLSANLHYQFQLNFIFYI